jgi:hypothetical protein
MHTDTHRAHRSDLGAQSCDACPQTLLRGLQCSWARAEVGAMGFEGLRVLSWAVASECMHHVTQRLVCAAEGQE